MITIGRTKFPNRHFSLRQFESYLSCPHQYYLAYVQKMKWPKVPSGAAFGTAMHKAIEKMGGLLRIGQEVDAELASKLFADTWELELRYSNPIEYKNGEDPCSLRIKGEELIVMFQQQFGDIRPTAVEQEFELPIPGRRFFKPRSIKGRLDLVVDGELWDFKTSARSTSQKEVDVSNQLTLYSWVYKQLYGREAATLKIVVLVKTKTPKIQVVETHRTERDHEALFEAMDLAIRGIRHKVYFKNLCTRFGCNSCTYCDVCKEA